ncbi:unnamed protein product, partial [Owenia fusiformis]
TMESSCTSNHSPSVQSQTDTKCIQCQSIFKKAKHGYQRYSLKNLRSKKFKHEFHKFLSEKVKREIKTFSKQIKPYKNWRDLMDQSSSSMPILTSTIESAVPKQKSMNEDDQAARVGVVTSILCYRKSRLLGNQFQKITSYQLSKHGCDKKMMRYLNYLGIAVGLQANQSIVERTDKEELKQWDEFYSTKGIKRPRSPAEEEEENNANKQQKLDQSEREVYVPKLSTEVYDRLYQPHGYVKSSIKPSSEIVSRRSARKCQKKILGKEWMTGHISDRKLLRNSGTSAKSNKEPRDTSARHISEKKEPRDTSVRHISENKEPRDTSVRHISENKEPRDTSAR